MNEKVTLEQLEEIVRLRAAAKARPHDLHVYGHYFEALLKAEGAMVEELLERRRNEKAGTP